MHQIFIGYKESDRRLANDLAQGLEAAGYTRDGYMEISGVRAYLLNQPGRARQCYRANRGEEVNGDLFELPVLEDLDLLRRLGYHRAGTAAVEQMMGK